MNNTKKSTISGAALAVILLGAGPVADAFFVALRLHYVAHGQRSNIAAVFEISRIERRLAGQTHRPLARDPAQLRSLFEARRDGYARADYRIEVIDDDTRSAVARILALPLF